MSDAKGRDERQSSAHGSDRDAERFSDTGGPSNEDAYYYDTRTGEVVRGRGHSWSSRMGPYSTAAEAAHALEKARARARAWDDDDKRWERDR